MGLRPDTSPSDTSSHDSAVTSGKAGARPSVQQELASSEQAGSAAPGNVLSSLGEVRTNLLVHTRQNAVDQSSDPRPVATGSFRSGQVNGEKVDGKPPLALAESANGEDRLTSTADGHEEGLDAFILEAGEILQTEGVRTLFIPENDAAELARFERSHVRIKQVAQRRRSEGRDAARALAREIAESLAPDELRSDRGGLFAGSGRPRIPGSRDRDGHNTTHPTSSHASAGPASASRNSIARTWLETSSSRSNRFALVDVAVSRWLREPANDSRMYDVSAALAAWFRENRNPTELDARAARQLKDDLKLHTPNRAQADAQTQPPHREQRPGADPERTGRGPRGPLPTPTGHSGGPPTRPAPRQPTDIRRHAHATASFAGQIRLDSGPDTGWNWTGRALRDVVTTQVIVRRGSKATLVDGPWPGGVQPLLVIAVGSHEGAWVRHPDGTKSWAAIEELTQVLRTAAEGQGLNRSIVLAWSGSGDQGLDLPRRVADITGRRVWAVAGELTVTRYGERDYLDLDTLSDWVPSDPSDREFSVPDRLEDPLADGPPQWWERVSTRTIVSKGRRLGRTFLGGQELTADSLNTHRNLSDSRTQVHLNPATLKILGPAQPMPAADYVIETHGTPQTLLVHLKTGEHLAVPAKDFISKVILKRPSMQDLMNKNAKDVARRRARRVIRMHVCSVGAQSDVRQTRTVILDSAASGRTGQLAAPPTPYTLDPLGALSTAQRMSNETGMDVVAGEKSVGMLGERHSFAFFQVTDVDGTPGLIRHLRPEPTANELTQLARTLGLASRDAPTADDQDAALRLVRALKLVFGDGVATNPDHDHLRLLKGAASIELMRRQDTVLAAKTPYFTKNLLDRVVRTHHRTSPGQILDKQAYQRTLDAAATDWHQNHRPLSGFVRLSQVRQVARAHEDDETRIRTVLGLPEHTPINRTHRSNEFWAQVATAELYASLDDVAGFEAHILHLDPHTHRRATDQRQSNQARQLVAWALAHGYNATNADVLAAANLVARGLTQPQTLLTVNPGGRDYAGLKLPRLDASQWLLSTTSAPGPWMHGGGPAPLLVTVQTTPPELRGRSRLRLTGHDGQQYVVTESEFAELLARDEIIYGAPLRVPLLLAMSLAATSNPGLPHTLAKRLGRTIWYTNAAVHWSTDHSSESAMIARMGDRPWAHVTPDGESSPDFAQMPSIRNIGGTPTSATGSRSGLDGPKSPEPALGSPYAESILSAHSGNASPAPELNAGPHVLLSRSQDEESGDASSSPIRDSLPTDADAVSGPSADAGNPLESSSPLPAREPITRAEKAPATKIGGSPDQVVDEQPLGPTRVESLTKGEGASVDSFRQQMLRRINPDGMPRSDGGAPGRALGWALHPNRGVSRDYRFPRQGEQTSEGAEAPHGYGVEAERGVAVSPQYRGWPAAATGSNIVTEEPAADPARVPLRSIDEQDSQQTLSRSVPSATSFAAPQGPEGRMGDTVPEREREGRWYGTERFMLQPIRDSRDSIVGYASLPQREFENAAPLLKGLIEAEHFEIKPPRDDAAGTMHRLPWGGKAAQRPYFFASHGDEHGVRAHSEAGDRVLDGEGLARVLKQVPGSGPLVLIACGTGHGGYGQDLANALGRPVYAPTSVIGVERHVDGTSTLYLRARDEESSPEFIGFAPSPRGDFSKRLTPSDGLSHGVTIAEEPIRDSSGLELNGIAHEIPRRVEFPARPHHRQPGGHAQPGMNAWPAQHPPAREIGFPVNPPVNIWEAEGNRRDIRAQHNPPVNIWEAEGDRHGMEAQHGVAPQGFPRQAHERREFRMPPQEQDLIVPFVRPLAPQAADLIVPFVRRAEPAQHGQPSHGERTRYAPNPDLDIADFSDGDDVALDKADDESIDERTEWQWRQPGAFDRELQPYNARIITRTPEKAIGFGSSRFGINPKKLKVFRKLSRGAPAQSYGDIKYRHDKSPLYRFDTRQPDEIFAKGFNSWNGKIPRSLRHYQRFQQKTGFVSATRNPLGYMPWCTLKDGTLNRYVIRARGGIDLVESLKERSFVWQHEVLFWKGIRPEFIDRVEQIDRNGNIVSVLRREHWVEAQQRKREK
ncbi:lonely Cys domain-containing protein [Streptomyces sp. NPDC060030]|uniref:lonely Cys domain-containing protein n=1 Tax=Streptomyces sp. NPDC060030 TaxID=3347042 RepID=UPI0036A2BAD7